MAQRYPNRRTRLIALRCTGVDNVDLAAAPSLSPNMRSLWCWHRTGISIARSTAYGKATSNLNGLVGFNMARKTVGIVGTGKIGTALARIVKGFDCKLLGHDS
jgi:D-lactate dehydrogenase